MRAPMAGRETKSPLVTLRPSRLRVTLISILCLWLASRLSLGLAHVGCDAPELLEVVLVGEGTLATELVLPLVVLLEMLMVELHMVLECVILLASELRRVQLLRTTPLTSCPAVEGVTTVPFRNIA